MNVVLVISWLSIEILISATTFFTDPLPFSLVNYLSFQMESLDISNPIARLFDLI